MALAAGTIFDFRASATSGNLNGAGFNVANANFVTDLTTDANTGNTASPVVSSATYTFVAGDVGEHDRDPLPLPADAPAGEPQEQRDEHGEPQQHERPDPTSCLYVVSMFL